MKQYVSIENRMMRSIRCLALIILLQVYQSSTPIKNKNVCTDKPDNMVDSPCACMAGLWYLDLYQLY